MIKELKRPERKSANVKVSEADIISFSLGLGDAQEFILPSQRTDYHSDERAVKLVADIKAGKKIVNRDLSGINLKGADITGGEFIACNFKGAVFYHTAATQTNFSDCCFDEAYFERTDLGGSNLKGSTFKRVFWKENETQSAQLDQDAVKYLTDLEKIIHKIESGELSIRSLAMEDLIHLDIRRIDFSNIDLEGIDLSMFALDGINLCGTYIDPKQLMSLAGWNSHCLNLRRIKEKERKRLCEELYQKKEAALAAYAKERSRPNILSSPLPTKNLVRPTKRVPETEEARPWGIEAVRPELEKNDKIFRMKEAARIAQAKAINEIVSPQQPTKEPLRQSVRQTHEKQDLSEQQKMPVPQTDKPTPPRPAVSKKAEPNKPLSPAQNPPSLNPAQTDISPTMPQITRGVSQPNQGTDIASQTTAGQSSGTPIPQSASPIQSVKQGSSATKQPTFSIEKPVATQLSQPNNPQNQPDSKSSALKTAPQTMEVPKPSEAVASSAESRHAKPIEPTDHQNNTQPQLDGEELYRQKERSDKKADKNTALWMMYLKDQALKRLHQRTGSSDEGATPRIKPLKPASDDETEHNRAQTEQPAIHSPMPTRLTGRPRQKKLTRTKMKG